MEQAVFTVNNVWMMVATALVFIMHLGFAALESGLTRSKNTTNVLFKNTLIPGIGLLTYALVGFNLMYPGFASGTSMDFFGFSGFGLTLPEGGETNAYNAGYTYWTDFLFQGMFAATCATIVSGAVAERIKLHSFMIFSVLFVAFTYPIIGSWKWGLGWLNTLGFLDFAGSTLVHSVGGWGALAGILLLGARIGKYEGKKVNTIAGHSMPLAVLGTFMLWLGWFGFNGGSVLSADPGAVSRVLVTTSLAAAAGGLAAAFTIMFTSKKYDLGMVLNGILAGLVGITAGADVMGILDSVLIGLISGVIVVFSVLAFDKLKIDDPVGALSVHLVCGIFGTLAVGIFGSKAGLNQLMIQALGVVACGAAAFGTAFLFFFVLKKTMGIRVTPEEEIEGLDRHEHGMSAYVLHNAEVSSKVEVTAHTNGIIGKEKPVAVQ
ncbi:MAG: ammonium transporter [Thermoflexibacter sp.]